MAERTDQVKIFAAGDVYVAPVGTTAPSDATSTLGDPWVKLGYISEDGPSFTPGIDTGEVRGWQSAYALRRFVNSRSLEMSFTLMQVWAEALKLAFGGGEVTGTTPDFEYTPPDPQEVDDRAVVIEGLDGDTAIRLYVPRASVSTVGAVSFQRGAASQVPITMEAVAEGTSKIAYVWVSDDSFDISGVS